MKWQEGLGWLRLIGSHGEQRLLHVFQCNRRATVDASSNGLVSEHTVCFIWGQNMKKSDVNTDPNTSSCHSLTSRANSYAFWITSLMLHHLIHPHLFVEVIGQGCRWDLNAITLLRLFIRSWPNEWRDVKTCSNVPCGVNKSCLHSLLQHYVYSWALANALHVTQRWDRTRVKCLCINDWIEYSCNGLSHLCCCVASYFFIVTVIYKKK